MVQLSGFDGDVPERLLRLIWELEDRGVTISMDDSQQLRARPRSAVTPPELTILSQHRDRIAELMRWIESLPVQESRK